MDMKKFLFVLLTLFHNVISMFIKKSICEATKDCLEGEICVRNKCRSDHPYDNINVMNRRFCAISDDCPKFYYCDNKIRRCSPVQNSEHVMQKQTCRKVFKKFCTKNFHCPCNKRPMVCEENECVYAKKSMVKKNAPCSVHLDCPIGYLCTSNNKCRQMKNIFELIHVTEKIKKRCQVDTDCKRDKNNNLIETCQNNYCKKKSNLCTKDDDCKSNETCHQKKCKQKNF